VLLGLFAGTPHTSRAERKTRKNSSFRRKPPLIRDLAFAGRQVFHAGNRSFKSKPYSSSHFGHRGTFVPANRFSFSETKGLSFFFTAYSLDKFALK